eukprot:6212733-Pleurochrysis_carterae.AAC.1
MPSGRANGPEKRRRTRRDVQAEPSTWSADRTSRCRLRRDSGRRVNGGRCSPRKTRLVEVNIRSNDDTETRDEYSESIRRLAVAA